MSNQRHRQAALVLGVVAVCLFAFNWPGTAATLGMFQSPLPAPYPPPIRDAEESLLGIVYGTSDDILMLESPSQKDALSQSLGGEFPLGIESPGLISLETIQADFYATFGHYWQGLTTHDAVPESGNPEPAILSSHPTDQDQSWIDVGVPVSTPIDIAITVDVYEGPDGSGYTITGQTIMSDSVWIRVMNFGPEDWRETPWMAVPEDTP